MQLKVDYYQNSSGTSEVKEEIQSLPVKVQKKIIRTLELVEKYGINFVTKSGLAKKLHGYDLLEIKIDFNKTFYRIFCVIKEKTCWLLHMFAKKSNSTPQREINTALNRDKDLDLQLAL